MGIPTIDFNAVPSADDVSDTQVEAALECLKMLADDCDGAVADDGMGFNRNDAEDGAYLAGLDWLEFEDAVIARNMLLKYHRQLPKKLLKIVRTIPWKSKLKKSHNRKEEKKNVKTKSNCSRLYD